MRYVLFLGILVFSGIAIAEDPGFSTEEYGTSNGVLYRKASPPVVVNGTTCIITTDVFYGHSGKGPGVALCPGKIDKTSIDTSVTCPPLQECLLKDMPLLPEGQLPNLAFESNIHAPTGGKH